MGGTRAPKSLSRREAASHYVIYHGAHHDDVPSILRSGLRGASDQPTVTTSREGAELYAQKRDWTAPKVLEIHVPRDQADRYLGEPEEGLPIEGTVHALRETLPPSFIRMVHEAARWTPSSGIFAPTTGLDHRLFDERFRLRGDVTEAIMTRLDTCLRTDAQLAGSDWQEWLHVWIFGGSVSEWAGDRPNEAAQDLDVLVGITDLAVAQGYNAFEGMDRQQAATALNAAFRACFNEQRWQAPFGGTWDLTAYCNPAVTDDITAIKPYAAWDLSERRWAVTPPHLPEHTIADFDPAVIAHARAVVAEARAILRMDEPLRTREATALWQHIHEHRCQAFSPEGTGWDDPGNVDEKFLAYAPRNLLGKIKELALAPKTAATENPPCHYCGEPLDDQDVDDGASAHDECSQMRWCEPHQEHHDDPNEAEDHNSTYTDWGQHLPFDGGIHRGITVRLPREAHQAVHDSILPAADRARILRNHLDASDHYGVHWTDHLPIAQAWGSGEGALFGSVNPADPEHTHVVFHAASPAQEHIEDDPEKLSGRNMWGFGHRYSEREVPLKEGAPVHLTGISWKRGGEAEWNRHDLASPMVHSAAAEKPSKTKAQVNYRPGSAKEHCGNCVMIRLMPPDFETHHCTLVKGNINPDAVCDEWAPEKTAKTGVRSWDDKSAGNVYLRFGDWPENERSRNNVTGFREEGVSAYDLDEHGDPKDPDPNLERGHYHDDSCDDDCDADEWNDEYGNDTADEMHGRVTRAERARYHGMDERSGVGHLVRGEMVGLGHDAEPLLKNVRRVGDWIDHRHLFIKGAPKHRLARDPYDDDYEPPEETPPPHHTAAAEAGPQGYLRNPYHGTEEFGGRDDWSHTWFHGTRGEANFGTRRKDSEEARRAALPPEQRTMNSGWTQPNQHLGVHFSPLHEVAHKFVGSVSSTPGSLVHARLRGNNPAVFDSEEHLNLAMADWGSKHYPHWHDEKLNANMGWNYGDQEGTHRDFSQAPENPRERWKMSQKAQSLLQWHPHMPEILAGFRQHLADQGHHGIIYGNSLEGPYETDAGRGGDASMKYIEKRESWPNGHPYSFSAIAHPDDIEITHVEHTSPWNTEPEPHQRTWEDISDQDENDEMRDKVLAWHRNQGGRLPFKLAAGDQDYRIEHRAPGPGHTDPGGAPASSVPYHEAAGRDPEELVDVYRGAPGHVGQINPGDWVTLHGDWAQDRIGDEDGHVLHARVPAKHVWLDAADRDTDEAGYHGPAIRAQATMDPDRYVTCDQGHQHWGAAGAAGLLIRHRGEEGAYRYLLQHRSPYVQHGGTWSTPGGALQHGETPEEGARREAEEEFGDLPSGLKHHHTFTDDHGGWAYHTVVMDAPHQFEPEGDGESDWEHGGHGWFTPQEMKDLPLHPGFAASWNHVRKSGAVRKSGMAIKLASAVEPDDHAIASEPHRVAVSIAQEKLRRDYPELSRPLGEQRTPVLRKMLSRASFALPDGDIEHAWAGIHEHPEHGVSQPAEDEHGHRGVMLHPDRDDPLTLAHEAGHLITMRRQEAEENRRRDPWESDRDLPSRMAPDHRDHGEGFAWNMALALDGAGHEKAAEDMRRHYKSAVLDVADRRHAMGLSRDFPGSGLSPHMPPDQSHLPPVPEEQQKAFDAKDSKYPLLDLAKNPVPGTRIWRGERRPAGEDPASPESVGLHWSVHPANVITTRNRYDTSEQPVIWQARMGDRPHEQAIPRSHPMWGGKHMSMDSEAEVRLRPQSTVHVEGAWVGDPDADERGAAYPLDPRRNGPGWTWHPIGKDVPVRYRGEGHTDYSEFGIHREAAAEPEGGPWYHLTTVDLKPGQSVAPTPWHEGDDGFLHFSDHPRDAQRKGLDVGRALGRSGNMNIYEVRPEGSFEQNPDDPGNYGTLYRTAHPLRVVRRFDPSKRQAATGYTGLGDRTAMIYLEIPEGLVEPHPGGVDDHHITLVYLGKNVSDERWAEACRRAKEAAAQCPPMDGVLRGIDIFPPSKSSDGKVPAFVPAYVAGVGRLRRLLGDLSASEHNEFLPHVTLAYLEEGDRLPAPRPAAWLRFDRIHLKRGDEVVSFPLAGQQRGDHTDLRADRSSRC